MTRQSHSLLLRLARKLPFFSTLITRITGRKQLRESESLPDSAQPPAVQEPRKAPIDKTRPPRPKTSEAKPATPPSDAKTNTQAPAAPACPHCRKTMVIKVARSGANAGGQFWGCTDYPQCRGIRAIFAPIPPKPLPKQRPNKRKHPQGRQQS